MLHRLRRRYPGLADVWTRWSDDKQSRTTWVLSPQDSLQTLLFSNCQAEQQQPKRFLRAMKGQQAGRCISAHTAVVGFASMHGYHNDPARCIVRHQWTISCKCSRIHTQCTALLDLKLRSITASSMRTPRKPLSRMLRSFAWRSGPLASSCEPCKQT